MDSPSKGSYAVVTDPATLDSSKIQALGRALGRPPADLRLALSGPVPRIMDVEDSEEDALSIRNILRTHGMKAFVIERSRLRCRPPVLHANTLQTTKLGITATDQEDKILAISASEVDIVTVGRRTLSTHTSKDHTLYAPLGVGGLGMGGMGGMGIPTQLMRTHTSARSEVKERFLWIWLKDIYRPAVEIAERHINYQFLGSLKKGGAAYNWAPTLQWLAQQFPSATMDQRMVKLLTPRDPPGSIQHEESAGFFQSSKTDTQSSSNTEILLRRALCLVLCLRGAWKQA